MPTCRYPPYPPACKDRLSRLLQFKKIGILILLILIYKENIRNFNQSEQKSRQPDHPKGEATAGTGKRYASLKI